MTAIDWLIVAFTALLAVYGYIQGFIVGALSLIGFLVGAFIGTRLAPLVLSQGARSPYAPLLGLLGALLAGGVLASGFEGVGARARAMLRLPGLRTIDGLLGAAADRLHRTRRRVDRRRGGAPVHRLAAAADRHPALGDPDRARPVAAAVGRDPQRAGPVRSAAVGPRPGRRRPGADAPDPGRRRGSRRLRQRRAGVRDRLRARRSRAAAGSPGPGSWSPTRTWSPASPTPRSRSAVSVPGARRT